MVYIGGYLNLRVDILVLQSIGIEVCHCMGI